jgi:DUF4097 and DUF4098 domain-containing protein YvlB
MNKETFLHELDNNLQKLNSSERAEAAEYYTEIICDKVENGASEEAVIQELGTPADIAQQILAGYEKIAESQPETAYQNGRNCYAAEKNVHTIILCIQNIHVDVKNVPDGNVRVKFEPLPTDKVTVSESDGVFMFTNTVPFHLFNWFGLFHMHSGITLEIPESFKGDISVTTDNARITAEHIHHIKKGSFTTDNARIIINDCTCDKLSLHTGNAKVEITNGNGNYGNIKTSNGKIIADNCFFKDTINLHTGNGSINAQSLMADNILLETSNASITATIIGDVRNYAINSHTSNGQNNLPTDWAFPEQTKHLTAKTSNARISVSFIDAK